MRELKFRALDPKEGWYYFTLQEVMTGKKNFTDEDWTVVEFTGLKDKHGKDIFEGDIIESGVNRFEIIYNKNRFEADTFYRGVQDDPSCIFSEDAHERYEIIGNIHENKNLLE